MTPANHPLQTRDAQCPSPADSDTTTAVIKTIGVGNGPQGVAVDGDSDVVYVTNADSDTLTEIDARTANVVRTVAGFSEPVGVAVNETDDTVYVANTADSAVTVFTGPSMTRAGVITSIPAPWDIAVDQNDDTVYVTAFNATNRVGSIAVFAGSSMTADDTLTIAGNSPTALAVNNSDDSVYVSGTGGTSVSVINGRTQQVDDTIPLVGDAWGSAVNQTDDTVYVANYTGYTLTAIDGRTSAIATTLELPPAPWGVAVDNASSTVYVTEGPSNFVSIIDGKTATLTQGIAVGAFPIAIAVDQSGTNTGVVYVANSDDSTVSVLGHVTPSLGSTWGAANSPLTISVNAPQVDYALDDSTVARVCFFPEAGGGGVQGTDLQSLGNDGWSVTIPRGLSSGRYAVSVEFNGGLTARTGTFTVPSLQIVGSRDSDKQKYVVVDGSSTGLAGRQVTPMVRFPGETGYSAGSGVRTVAADGTFTWQRKANRKVYVYFVANHGVRSNRVIINPS